MSAILVSGASSGIGAALVDGLRRTDHAVIGLDLDPRGDDRILAADVTDQTSCEAAVAAAVETHGGLAGVVNCAGIERQAPAAELAAEVMRATLEVNVTGSFLLSQAAAKHWIARGEPGSIVLLGSVNSQVALPMQAAYAASKGAVLMLGKALAVDWAQHGIRVNTVAPGLVDTPMSRASIEHPVRNARLLNGIPLNRAAAPEELLGAVEFLLGAGASYVTGACLAVDGGWLAYG